MCVVIINFLTLTLTSKSVKVYSVCFYQYPISDTNNVSTNIFHKYFLCILRVRFSLMKCVTVSVLWNVLLFIFRCIFWRLTDYSTRFNEEWKRQQREKTKVYDFFIENDRPRKTSEHVFCPSGRKGTTRNISISQFYKNPKYICSNILFNKNVISTVSINNNVKTIYILNLFLFGLDW